MNERTSFIPEELMRARIAQSEQLREFFIQMWLENPQMAAAAGRRIREIMAPAAVPLAPTFAAHKNEPDPFSPAAAFRYRGNRRIDDV